MYVHAYINMYYCKVAAILIICFSSNEILKIVWAGGIIYKHSLKTQDLDPQGKRSWHHLLARFN